MPEKELIEKLNNALSWELRAINMYAHYSAYVQGIHRLQLSGHFQSEVTESIGHADTVRAAIVKLGGVATTERAPQSIIHSTDYIEMLKQAYETEKIASNVYGELLELLKAHNDEELFDAIETIYFTELRSAEQIRMLLN